MNPAIVQARTALLLRHAQLLARLRSSHPAIAAPENRETDLLDQASQEEAATIDDSISAAELRELDATNLALRRLETGAWGFCRACGGEIHPARLVALPEAELCIGCASTRH